MAVYNSKRQEEHFKPERIRVLTMTLSRTYSEAKRYIVARQNMLTHEVTHEWVPTDENMHRWTGSTRRRPNHLPDGEWRPMGKWPSGDLFIKKLAVDIAKDQAVRLKRPFDLQRDIVGWKDAVYGPTPTECAAGCGGWVKERTFVPMICDDCKSYMQIGRRTIEEREPWHVETRYLVPSQAAVSFSSPGYDGYSKQLADLIAELGGSALIEKHEPYGRETHTGGTLVSPPWKPGRHGRDRTSVFVWLDEKQFNAAQGIVSLINVLVANSYINGQEAGSSILRKLMADPEGVIQINNIEERKAQRVQAPNNKEEDLR